MASELPPEQTANVIIAVVGAFGVVASAIVAGVFGARKRDRKQEQVYQPKPHHVALDDRSLDALKELAAAAGKMADALHGASRATADHADEVREHRRDMGELNRTINRKGND